MFTFIYTLPWAWVLLLMPIMVLAYLALLVWSSPNCRSAFRNICLILLIAWAVTILARTVFLRQLGEPTRIAYLFESYTHIDENNEIFRLNFMNILLFFPGGLLFAGVLPERWSRLKRGLITGFPLMLMSIGIEACQYYFQLGSCEIDDVFHNTLGALFGFGAAMTAQWSANRIDQWRKQHG